MNIKIIAIGKLKESFLKEACDEYLKRLGRFAKVSVIELPEERISDKASAKEEEHAKDVEAERMVEKVRDNELVILLTPEGKAVSSEHFAERIRSTLLSGTSNITFLIGGSLGLGRAARQRGDLQLSFSKMTFPHQLFRVMLLEQIYRACKINANEIYHK
ncbi:MAG: 23S rRNA (pseudouridine(1915)-N(3))-methyltransferase RlmH [Peptostreptococcaceae bacterium]|nr:23S rRNA (pseudouridine(1915)-N(3))-methyltransferase RlmH [Peptostreptococcaceae bacterium]